LTGSGITLDSIVRHAAAAGHDQRAVVGVPLDDPHPEVGGLRAERIYPLIFGRQPLEFAVPGMSDVMPYPSTRFSTLDEDQLSTYQRAWSGHLRAAIDAFKPDLVHSHHVWLMSSLIKEVAPDIRVLVHCHATGLRQMELCPYLAESVRRGCSRADAFAVLHRSHAKELEHCLGVSGDRIHVVGAGYREDLFFGPGPDPGPPALLYVGKYSAAKGLPWLLDAFERITPRRPGLKLHVVGGGSGSEAESLRIRMNHMAPSVVQHGLLSQPELAEITRRATVCVLPSFFEGLPLVLVEALACGCRLVATDLPAVSEELAPRFGDLLVSIARPRLEAIDRPREEDLPAFVDRLEDAIDRSLDAPSIGDPMATIPNVLAHFTWGAVFRRIETVWKSLS
jgi:glycosyltransferase involved in cell wall biosynthesis